MPQLKQKDFDLELKYLELKGENILRNQSQLGNSMEATSKEEPCDSYISMLIQIQVHKWNCKIDLIIQDEKFELIALIDSRANSNCIQEGLIPTKYYEKILRMIRECRGQKLIVKYKL